MAMPSSSTATSSSVLASAHAMPILCRMRPCSAHGRCPQTAAHDKAAAAEYHNVAGTPIQSLAFMYLQTQLEREALRCSAGEAPYHMVVALTACQQ